MSRGRTDFIILHDEDQFHEQSHVVSRILHKLLSRSLNGHIWKKSILPGDNKIENFNNAVTDTGFVICLFERNHISATYINQLKMSYSIKMKQELDGAIIPVFDGMTTDKADELIERYPSLSFLTLYAASYTGEEHWEDSILRKITTPCLGW